jgi:hypothetical protein
VAGWLFASIRRIGQLRFDDLTLPERRSLEMSEDVEIVDARVKTRGAGHAYFLLSPEVSSDLILLLRDNADAGAENGRPLVKRGTAYWEVHKGYPHVGRD